jgi:hypothetical protein
MDHRPRFATLVARLTEGAAPCLASLAGQRGFSEEDIFLSNGTSSSSIDADLGMIKAQVDDALAGMDEESRAGWERRIHYVEGNARMLGNWVSDLMRSPGWGFGIDRFQRIRYIGSFADLERYDSSYGWFAPNLSMAANEAIFYNFEAEREAQMRANVGTVLRVFDHQPMSDSGWAGARTYAEVDFGSPDDLAAHDTLTYDLSMDCDGDGEYGDCPAWDYLVYLYLCDEDDPATSADESESCGTEIGRWITTYHREGRWVHDASAMLPLIAGGGVRRLAFYTQQLYDVTLDIHLSNAGKEATPAASTWMWSGGGLDLDYNDEHAAIELDIPATATKVELATVISGHGMSSTGNCAEFCNTTHDFIVNGETYTRDFPEAGASVDCMDKVSEGTVPNQYGTWWYGRSGWCPGKEVPVVMTDITSAVTPGMTNLFEYQAWYNGAPFAGSGANIRLTSWVVVSD